MCGEDTEKKIYQRSGPGQTNEIQLDNPSIRQDGGARHQAFVTIGAVAGWTLPATRHNRKAALPG